MRRSTSAYTQDWPDVAKKAKAAAGWCCVRCGSPNQPGNVLTVHHLDMSPENNSWWNLAALCQVCHLQIQAKVRIEQPYLLGHSEWFKPYVAGYYAHLNGIDESREYVMQHLDELIEMGMP